MSLIISKPIYFVCAGRHTKSCQWTPSGKGK